MAVGQERLERDFGDAAIVRGRPSAFGRRQFQQDLQPAHVAVGQGDAAAVGAGQFLDDGQAQTGARRVLVHPGAAFQGGVALLGGQEIINDWVLGMDLTPVQFMILDQVVIFLLGWPLEWTEIIVIFMPIFVPLLQHFNIDPLFFGLLVAMNLQTAFLSPPVAMSAFYLKGVSPPHVTLNQIFLGMLPFMGLQVLGIILLYTFPAIGMWLPEVLYK